MPVTIATDPAHIGVRWTLGDVSDRGYEALRLSVWGAYRVFGPRASYAICVNTVPLGFARRHVGELPTGILWRDATADVPRILRDHFDGGMAEGVGWKLAPLRVFPGFWEISLDNDCILWDLPQALQEWFAAPTTRRCAMAQDVKACFGIFGGLCGPDARNAGLRGLPPEFDLQAALQSVLRDQERHQGRPVVMTSELDEQGLQAAALSRYEPPLVVSLDDLSICSPFWPHSPELGHCGAHFVGLNARHITWDYYDRPADVWMAEHWARHRPALMGHVGLGLAGQPAPERPVGTWHR